MEVYWRHWGETDGDRQGWDREGVKCGRVRWTGREKVEYGKFE